ncbi:unnamed protein product [Paramecium sonneborni]|uniref:Uncharacterized protein n=1 Tax=Paramecium sonneborni TaxID=65129 RepID=A0A8S1M6Z8_9CILI|nr:unnamed protein product [Paramecium sonneborni]
MEKQLQEKQKLQWYIQVLQLMNNYSKNQFIHSNQIKMIGKLFLMYFQVLCLYNFEILSSDKIQRKYSIYFNQMIKLF